MGKSTTNQTCYIHEEDFKEDFGNNIDKFGARLDSQKEVQRMCHREDDNHRVSCNIEDITLKIPLFYGKNNPYT